MAPGRAMSLFHGWAARPRGAWARRLVLLLLPLALCHCQSQFSLLPAGQPPGEEARLGEGFFAGAADWQAAMQRREAALLSRPESRARRQSEGLALRLDDGSWRQIPEDRACPNPQTGGTGDLLKDCVAKYLIEYFPGASNPAEGAVPAYWLLALRLKEGEAYALVDAARGNETAILGLPYFAPGQAGGARHLLALNRGLVGDTQNGIEIWRLGATGPELAFYSAVAGEAEFSFIDWLGAGRARLSYRACRDPARACSSPNEAQLALTGGKWRLLLPPTAK